MRWAIVFIGAMSFLLGGCASELKPSPGMSGLRVKVAAEPKKGLESAHVAVYDSGSTDVGHGAFERVDYSDLNNIVVSLEPIFVNGSPKILTALHIIDLDAEHPRSGNVDVAQVGEVTVFRNIGSHPLSAYSVSDGNTFNLGTIPPGQQIEQVLKAPGLVEILTDASPDPIASVYAAGGLRVAATHSGATVDFNDIPPGKYRVKSWHPRLPGSVIEVEVAADQAKTVTIDVTVNSLPKIDAK